MHLIFDFHHFALVMFPYIAYKEVEIWTKYIVSFILLKYNQHEFVISDIIISGFL